MARSKKTDYFVWTDDEVELLLRITLDYKTFKSAQNLEWESCQSKYDDILQQYKAQYPLPEEAGRCGKDFPHKSEEISRIVLISKLKYVRIQYRQAVDSGKQSGHGKAVLLYFELCEAIWGGCPATHSLPEGMEETADDSFLAISLESPVLFRPALSSPTTEEEGTAAKTGAVPSRGDGLGAALSEHGRDGLKRRLSSESSLSQEDLHVKRALMQRLDAPDRDFSATMATMLSTMERLTSEVERLTSALTDASNPLWQSRGSAAVSAGGRFRCPSCRHEVVLDRHGIFGLQRNLLVENIIDIYKQESARPVQPKSEQQVMCNQHEDEKINIYCLSCETPTCSMCKVFGPHRDCEVAPLQVTYDRQKTELSDSIAMLVAGNDRIQTVITQLEATGRTIEENGRRQKQQLCASFDALYAVLEQRKTELVECISREQDCKLGRIRALIRRHGDHLESTVKLVEAAIRSMEEPQMAVFLQNAKDVFKKITDASLASDMEQTEPGYESMAHFAIDADPIASALRAINFQTAPVDEEGEESLEDQTGREKDPRRQ